MAASIRDYHNIHPGGRVFITASGPSLLEFDPELLRGEYIITVNETINRFPWAQYSTALDHGPYEVCTKKSNTLFTTRKDAYPNVKLALDNSEPFKFDLDSGVNVGATTAFVALQIAWWMGFHDIYICGVDLGITDTHTHFYGEKNRFQECTGINFPAMKKSFEEAAPLLLSRNVVNCSTRSLLDCFPKQDIHDVLGKAARLAKEIVLYKPIEYKMVKMLTLEDNVVKIGSKFWIKLPNGEILPERYTMKERAKTKIDAINEQIRRKGGRPRKNKE